MAKEQKRNNREAKKPKMEKKKPVVATSTVPEALDRKKPSKK